MDGMFRNLGSTLRVLRDLRRLSQTELARAARIGKSQLSKYENGRELPKLDSIERILGVLGVRPSDLFFLLDVIEGYAVPSKNATEPAEAAAPSRTAPLLSLFSDRMDHAFDQLARDLLALQRVVLEERLPKGAEPPEEREK
jgi:transcriptional regulator with XRE-family HTH domain